MSYHYWQGEIIQLRAVEAQDIAFFETLDDEVNRNVDMLHFPTTKQNVVSWFESQQQRMFGDTFRFMAVNRAGEIVGTIDTFACNRRHGTFKYGITVGEAYRGQGYAQEMIRMVLRYYYEELGYQKVTPHVYSFNTASIKLHETMGFVKEGQLRSMLYTNGQYVDEIYYGMTKEEFVSRYGDRN
ncbi:MAG: GNAT family protein [Paenibacillaceae bacterium]